MIKKTGINQKTNNKLLKIIFPLINQTYSHYINAVADVYKAYISFRSKDI